MKHEESAGAIIWRKNANSLEFLLIESQAYKQFSSYWSFPKGHLEESENHTQAAQREVFEEVGLKPSFNFDFASKYTYLVTKDIEKTVTLFLAKADSNQTIKVQPTEVKQAKWLTYSAALKLLQPYPDLAKALTQASNYLLKH